MYKSQMVADSGRAVGQGAKMVVVNLAVRLMAMVQLDNVKKR